MSPRHIVVDPYDPAWVSEFERESRRITQALDDLVVRLHHIGSTAIPGIFAKPIIDMLLEVDDIGELDRKTAALEGLGYEAHGEFGIPGRRYFRKNDHSGVRTHQIHSFQVGSPEIERHLAFRDYMIAHPADARQYSELKRRVATEYPDDIESYMDGKDPFIKKHEAKALAWRRSQNASET